MSTSHMYAGSERINLEALRRDARKREERDGRHTIIHHHLATQSCSDERGEYEHEEYGLDQ